MTKSRITNLLFALNRAYLREMSEADRLYIGLDRKVKGFDCQYPLSDIELKRYRLEHLEGILTRFLGFLIERVEGESSLSVPPRKPVFSTEDLLEFNAVRLLLDSK